jgi:ankyrin repeat protein
MFVVEHEDPRAHSLIEAIRSGAVEDLQRLLIEHPGLAAARIQSLKGRTPLHVATDWPGYFPRGPEIVAVLIAAGGDPNAAMTGPRYAETPLHWAASSDDVDVAEALIVGGADIEAAGGSIGTPLGNAVGYGCWRVARLLVGRGARVELLWQAAALGLMARVADLLAASPPPSAQEISDAFWQACHGGQRRVAEYLYARGADPHWVPDYAKESALEAAAGPDTGRQALLSWLKGKAGAKGG